MPSATGQMRVEYNDFSGGDYGNTDPSKTPGNTFHAQNILVASDGCLVPRPGWRDRSPSGMPVGKVVGFTPTATPTREIILLVGNKVYTYNLSTGASLTEIGTLDSTPTKAVYPKRGTTEYYITVPGDKCYSLDPVSNTINPLDGSPGGIEVEVYEYRLMVADSTTPYRVKFSAAGDFESWPAENFFDTRDKWQITGIREQNNHLAILKSRGSYALSGVPGTTSAVLRRVNRGLGPLHPGQVDIDEKDRVHLVQAFHHGPSTFDGVNTDTVPFLDDTLDTVRDGDTPDLPLVLGVAESLGARSHSTVMFVQGGGSNIMLLNHNGVWTRHHVEVGISGMVHGGYTRDFYITDGGSDSTAGKIMSNQFDLNRPATVNDTLVRIGDLSDTPLDAWVQFPQHWVPQTRHTTGGTEIAIRQVIVDFDKYNTGATAHNHMDISVDVLGRPDGKGDADRNTFSWDEVGSVAGSTGAFKRDRIVHGFQSARGAGFQITLGLIRGVKIRQVIAVYDIFDTRPRS